MGFTSKMYTMEGGKMVEIDQTENNNLQVGTLLQWEGYAYNKMVIVKKNTSDFDGAVYYDCVNVENAEFSRIESWGLKPISEKKDHRIAVYILPEVMAPAAVLALYEKATALKDLAQKKADAAAAARAEAIERGRKIAAEKIPAEAQALIIAAHDVDKCDIQTDYFHHETTQIIVLAASKHKRDLFSEMRKAAALLPETAHLGPGKGKFTVYAVADKDVINGGSALAWKGSPSHWHDEIKKDFDNLAAAEEYMRTAPAPGPIEFQGCGVVTFSFKMSEEKIEHREKYSMGAGYYLKEGWRDSTGWKVYKICRYNGADWPAEIYLSLGQVCKL